MTTATLDKTEYHLVCGADRRVAAPRVTSCPIAVLCVDLYGIAASPGYGLASTFRDSALNTRQVLYATRGNITQWL